MLAGQIEVEFFGPETDWLQEKINSFGLERVVFVRGRVDRPSVLVRQQASDRLLLLETAAPEAQGVTTGKLFEYMAANRPILSVGSGAGSAIDRILTQCGIGRCVGADVRLIKQEVLTLLTGAEPGWYQPRLEELRTYSRERQADRVLELIDEVNLDG